MRSLAEDTRERRIKNIYRILMSTFSIGIMMHLSLIEKLEEISSTSLWCTVGLNSNGIHLSQLSTSQNLNSYATASKCHTETTFTTHRFMQRMSYRILSTLSNAVMWKNYARWHQVTSSLLWCRELHTIWIILELITCLRPSVDRSSPPYTMISRF